jgi:hypothetical protein
MSDAAMAAAAPPVVKKGINLALQGGGAHGAFTWGVLDYLLEGWTPDVGAIQSDALTLRTFRDTAGFDHGGLLEISLRACYCDDCRRETAREFQGAPQELPITPRR